jgi:hypothetical protein
MVIMKESFARFVPKLWPSKQSCVYEIAVNEEILLSNLRDNCLFWKYTLLDT